MREIMQVLISLATMAWVLSVPHTYELRAVSIQSQATPRLRLAELTATEVAFGIAAAGSAAGVVATLPPRMADADTTATQVSSGISPSALADSWLRDHSRNVSELLSIIPAGTPASQVVAAYSAALPHQGWRVSLAADGKIPVLTMQSATNCQRALRRTLRAPVEAVGILRVASQLANAATGARIPGGFVGSCTGVTHDESVRVAAGQTLEDGLSEAVASFGSSVWLAVQGPGGQCSLGVIEKAEKGDKVCAASLVEDIAR